MDISGELLEGINLTWDDEDCFQTLDYEHIPFRCRRCHEHGHLYRECPLATMAQGGKPKEDKDAEGFTKVTGRKRQARRGQPQETNKKAQTVNRYEILGKQEEENHLKEGLEDSRGSKVGELNIQQKEGTSKDKGEEMASGDTDMQGEEEEDMEVGELNLDEIEQACLNPEEGYIPSQQVTLLRDAIIKVKKAKTLGVTPEHKKDPEGKRRNAGDKRGRRSNKQRIRDVGEKLKASRLYPTIEEAFNINPKVTQ